MENVKCPFCNIADRKILFHNKMGFVIEDNFPVSKGHLLIIPYRHFADYFEVSSDEKNQLFMLLDKAKVFCDEEYQPSGYNVGINIGADAGQTINHMHIHLIPRYKGDVEDPGGGVRGVIKRKQRY